MTEFKWNDENRAKLIQHSLAEWEVEAAWPGRTNVSQHRHGINGPYFKSFGVCPSGRGIWMLWRYNTDEFGDELVYIINAYGGGN